MTMVFKPAGFIGFQTVTDTGKCRNPPASGAGRIIGPTSPCRFFGVQVRQNLTVGSSSTAKHRDWPQIVASSAGICGFTKGLRWIGSVSFWSNCHCAEPPLEHTDLPRNRGQCFEEVLRHMSAPFRNPRKSAGLKSTVLPASCGRFLPRSALAFLPSSDGGRMPSRPSRPDQDLLRQPTSRCCIDDPLSFW